MQILYSRPPSHGHECEFILVRSDPFQKAGRRDVAFTQLYKNKPSEPVQNRFKIRIVRNSKSEPEIGPVRKRTIPFPYEQKKADPVQVHFREPAGFLRVHASAFHLLSPSILEKLSYPAKVPVFFFIFRHKLLNFNPSEPPNSFLKLYYLWFFFPNFFNHELSPFRRLSMNVVNCLEIFCMHVCIFGRIKKLQILFLGCLKKP